MQVHPDEEVVEGIEGGRCRGLTPPIAIYQTVELLYKIGSVGGWTRYHRFTIKIDYGSR